MTELASLSLLILAYTAFPGRDKCLGKWLMPLKITRHRDEKKHRTDGVGGRQEVYFHLELDCSCGPVVAATP